MNLTKCSNEIVRIVKHSLKSSDFRTRGKTLYRQYGDVIQMINFQSSASNTPEVMKFTINLGIYLKPLALLDEDPEMTTDIHKCHWGDRIGSYMGGGTDYWWTIRSETQIGAVSSEIAQILDDSAITALNELSSADALCVIWKKGGHPGIYEFQRERYLELLCEK
jgi:hypothetical protein